MEFNSDIQELARRFDRFGFPLYAVGGCVRDKYLNVEPDDIDLATSANTEQMEEILAGLKMDFQGKSFGVMHVSMEHDVYQIATFRKDISVGRRPEVELGVSLEVDAFRRDFTCNALYYDLANKKFVDPTGGIKDIEQKILRTPGPVNISFGDDPLRKIRAFRFASSLGFSFDKELAEYLKNDNSITQLNKEGWLERVSQERVHGEFTKALKKSKSVVQFLRLCSEYDMLNVMFPNTIKTATFVESRSVEVVMSFLIGKLDININREAETHLIETLKFSEDQARGAMFLSRLWNLTSDNVKIFHRAIKSTSLTHDDIMWFARISQAITDHGVDPFKVEAFLSFTPTLATELLNNGWKEGKKLGEELNRLDAEKFNIAVQKYERNER